MVKYEKIALNKNHQNYTKTNHIKANRIFYKRYKYIQSAFKTNKKVL